MTGDISLLHSLVPYNGTTKVMIGNGVLLPISHIGTANISSLTLSDVFLVPDLKKNLISIQKLCLDNSYIVQFSQNTFYVKDPQTMSILLQSNSSGSLYPIQCAAVLALTSQVVPISVYHHTWHQRLGHPALFVFQHLVSNKLIVCNSMYVSGKHVKQPFIPATYFAQTPFELIFFDVWESPVLSPTGIKNYIFFIDSYSRYSWVYPLKRKSDSFYYFKKFHKMVSNVFQSHIKQFQADEGGEFHKLEPYLNKHGILFRYSCPATPQQNGVAERKHRHVAEKLRCLLFQSQMPNIFWVEALHYVVYLINKLPSASLNNATPYYLLFKQQPDYSMIKTFGCLCCPHLTKQTNFKYSPRTLPCIFLGVSPIHKGYRCYNPEVKRVLMSMFPSLK
ncbi:hypothetical protein LIER_23284 [Lithospermum erythrorhizon]|uniref:Integrase catalytic domain-containing protein n=1 Tax=Lithospermum erythrorhizon TaxID=34254 RepID=A0AAV3QY55_LITER